MLSFFSRGVLGEILNLIESVRLNGSRITYGKTWRIIDCFHLELWLPLVTLEVPKCADRIYYH